MIRDGKLIISNKWFRNGFWLPFMLLIYPSIEDKLFFVLSLFGAKRTVFNGVSNICSSLMMVVFVIMMVRKLPLRAFVSYCALLLTLLFSYFLTSYQSLTIEALFTLLFSIFPPFLIGMMLHFDESWLEGFYKCSVASVAINVAYELYNVFSRGLIISGNKMYVAYAVLPCVLFLIAGAFYKKSAIRICLAIVGCGFVLILGSRGPLLCILCYVLGIFFKRYGSRKFVILCSMIVVLVAFFTNSASGAKLLVRLSERMESMGLSSRIVTYLIADNITYSNGRDVIEETLINDIKDNPLTVRGFFSDREATIGLRDPEIYFYVADGTYAHNIVLELLHNFGVLIGGVLLAVIFVRVIKYFCSSKRETQYFAMVLICAGFVKLFVSDSYLLSSIFFYLMGNAFNAVELGESFCKRGINNKII